MKIDAVLHERINDSIPVWYFNSPDASGLHRSDDENKKKDALTISSFGGHTKYADNKMALGLTYLNQQYSQEYIRKNTSYTQEIFPAGFNIQNIGSDFRISLGKIVLFSEIAADTKARIAIFGGLQVELHPLIRFSMVYRNYQPDYLGLRSSGFGESRGTKNEEGYYLGLQMYPWKYLKVDAYADHYSFPFLRYNSTNPFAGNDYLLSLTFYPAREFIITMRFRYEKTQNRSSDFLTGIDLMETLRKGGYRLELNYELSRNIKLKSRVEFSYVRNAKQPVTTGFYSGHDMGYISGTGKIRLWLRYAVYDIPGWDNRIYAYENDVQSSFTVPALSSKGTRFIIMGKADIFKGLEFSMRYALSQFQGIKIIGTGNDEVRTGSDSNWTIQIKYKF
jgi:hypothetical protein